MVVVERQAAERGHPSPHQSAFPRVDWGTKSFSAYTGSGLSKAIS